MSKLEQSSRGASGVDGEGESAPDVTEQDAVDGKAEEAKKPEKAGKSVEAAEDADGKDIEDTEDTEADSDADSDAVDKGTADKGTADKDEAGQTAAAIDDAEIKAMKAKVKAAKAEMKAAKKAAARKGGKRPAGERSAPGLTTVIALGVAAVVLAVPAVLLSLKASELGQSAEAADQAVHAASQVARDLSSYDYRTLDADTKTALAGTTGKLRTDYQMLAQQIRQLAVQQQAVSQTTVIKAGVETSSPDRVTVIVFANRTTAKAAQEQQSLPEPLRIRITMVKVGDRWLASELAVL